MQETQEGHAETQPALQSVKEAKAQMTEQNQEDSHEAWSTAELTSMAGALPVLQAY